MDPFLEYCITHASSLNEIKIYYEQHNQNINTQFAFLECCDRGYLNIVQWLYSLENINIHALDEYSFRWSCLHGHLDVAKWLYSLGVNIHVYNDFSFRGSCRRGHLHVAQWLSSICDDYELYVVNNQINYDLNKKLWFKNFKMFLFIFQ